MVTVTSMAHLSHHNLLLDSTLFGCLKITGDAIFKVFSLTDINNLAPVVEHGVKCPGACQVFFKKPRYQNYFRHFGARFLS